MRLRLSLRGGADDEGVFSPEAADQLVELFGYLAERRSPAVAERYTGIRYPFGKFDFVLIPAFQPGGMEHAGAVFLREESVLALAQASGDALGQLGIVKQRQTAIVGIAQAVADKRLGNRTWILGDRYSIADIHLFRVYWRFRDQLERKPGEFPSLEAHHARMLERPAVQKTIEVEAKG